MQVLSPTQYQAITHTNMRMNIFAELWTVSIQAPPLSGTIKTLNVYQISLYAIPII